MVDNIWRRTLRSGEHIFREGEAGVNAFILQSGSVEVYRSVDGVDKVLATIGEGAIFGEMAVIDASPRMASARMGEAGTIIVVTKKMFEAKMLAADPFIRGLLRILVENLRVVQGGHVRS